MTQCIEHGLEDQQGPDAIYDDNICVKLVSDCTDCNKNWSIGQQSQLIQCDKFFCESCLETTPDDVDWEIQYLRPDVNLSYWWMSETKELFVAHDVLFENM